MIEMYVIYTNPKDYPDKFVVRRWVGLVPDPSASVKDTLLEARAALPPGLVFSTPYAHDDPCIAEVWL